MMSKCTYYVIAPSVQEFFYDRVPYVRPVSETRRRQQDLAYLIRLMRREADHLTEVVGIQGMAEKNLKQVVQEMYMQ